MNNPIKNILNSILNLKSLSLEQVTENKTQSNNITIKLKQIKVLIGIIFISIIVIGVISLLIGQKTVKKTIAPAEPTLTVELADKNLDPEKHWRNHFEEIQEKSAKEVEEKLEEMSRVHSEVINNLNKRIEEELNETKEKLAIAQRELSSASLDLKRAYKEEQNKSLSPDHIQSDLSMQEFDNSIEFDRPKSAKQYIPEGIYFTGYLLGGIAVSTGLNTPQENAVPVDIQLMPRFDAHNRRTTNLSPLNELDLKNCRIRGSSYGDLSSERVVIRLEKLICEKDGYYISSKIAGIVFGSDGLNGIKGTVVSTSNKHIKNAALGGLISGLSGAIKGQEVATLSQVGLIQTKKKGAASLLGDGALQGVSNAGDKLADHYLRLAESMSPILTIPSGVRVNAKITEGFFVGEISTHKRINAARSASKPVKSESDLGYEQ